MFGPVHVLQRQGNKMELQRRKDRVVIDINDDCSDLSRVNKAKRRSRVSLWLTDALMLCLEHLQMFALILSLSLGWAWPRVWIQGTSFVFLLINFDLWEFAKVQTVYTGGEQAFPDPLLVPFNYLGFSIAWLLVVILVTLSFGLIYVLIPRVPFFSVVYSLQLRARLVLLFTVVAQALCLPFGLTVVRLFDCQNFPSGTNGELVFRSVVLSNTECWSAAHLGILIPMLIVATGYFIVLPLWMIYTIGKQVQTSCICTLNSITGHENLLQLKEAEYVEGLDIAWETKHYAVFSSFRLPWVWYRPFTFFVKGVLLVVYGSLFYVPYYQTIVLFAVVCLVVLILCVVPGRVYRLTSFNIMLILGNMVNLVNLTLGLCLVLGVQSFFLTDISLTFILLATNVAWLIAAMIWLCYLFIHCSYHVKKKYGPLWPTLSELDWSSKWKSDNTAKYFQAILRGRRLIEECYSSPTLFAPVHRLSEQIHIVNAYCSEAELVDNVAHGLLRALLTQLVEVHNHLRPLSVFGVSKTDEVPSHVRCLATMMPDLTRRLEQREYDLILSTPSKRRLLLKLLAVATFQGLARNCSKHRRDTRSLMSGGETEPIEKGDIVRKKPNTRTYSDADTISSPSLASSFELNFPDTPDHSMSDLASDQDKVSTRSAGKTGAKFKTLATITEQEHHISK